ncbi:MAG: acyl-CoA thioesterase [Prevotella sp.]|nr:acyl-CoA thioesterase [Prevotella sp.]
MEENIKFRHSMPAQIRFSDVDQFGHVNNSVYFALYDLAKTTYVKDVLGDSVDWRRMGIVVANINANFLLPVFFDDKIKIETATVHLGNKSFTLLQRAVTEDTGEVKCECKTVMVMFDLKEKQPMQIPDEFKAIIRDYENNSF